MDLIVRANKELFLEVKTMCQAPAEGVKDSRGETYHYNYVTVSGLKENTVYY